MNILAIIMAVFSLAGALDRIFGNRLGLGKEFEKGFMLLGTMALSMIGMIVLAPVLSDLFEPAFAFVYNVFGVDPSLIPAALFANDMGGAPMAVEIAQDEAIGKFNALVVSSMMGATVSFTIPFALGCVKKEKHKPLFFGLLCGIVTVPVGCLGAGLLLRLPVGTLLWNLLPLLLFSLLIAAGLLLLPGVCVRLFGWFGVFMKVLITAALACAVFTALTGVTVIPGLAPIEEGATVCFNAALVMSGAFPLMFVISKLLAKPMGALGGLLKINDTAALGFVGTLATNVTTLEMMNKMDNKGAVLNGAFAVSAAFTFAAHLAFTMAFDAAYVPYMIVGKLLAGVTALVFALLLYPRIAANIPEE